MQATKGYFAGTHPTRTGKSKSPSGMDQKTGHTIHGGVVVVVVSLPKSGERGTISIKRKETKKERRIEARITGQTGPFGGHRRGPKAGPRGHNCQHIRPIKSSSRTECSSLEAHPFLCLFSSHPLTHSPGRSA